MHNLPLERLCSRDHLSSLICPILVILCINLYLSSLRYLYMALQFEPHSSLCKPPANRFSHRWQAIKCIVLGIFGAQVDRRWCGKFIRHESSQEGNAERWASNAICCVCWLYRMFPIFESFQFPIECTFLYMKTRFTKCCSYPSYKFAWEEDEMYIFDIGYFIRKFFRLLFFRSIERSRYWKNRITRITQLVKCQYVLFFWKSFSLQSDLLFCIISVISICWPFWRGLNAYYVCCSFCSLQFAIAWELRKKEISLWMFNIHSL